MEDLISIILPVFNRASILRECIQSVLAQSCQNFEILLIDDGSTDGTLELCRTLAEAEPRISVVSIAHAGVSAARNTGIEAARGEYLFFMDSDDVIHPQLLEALLDGLKHSDAGIAGTGVVNVPQKYWSRVPEKIRQEPGPGKAAYLNHQDTLQAVFRDNTPINVIGGVMMRRELIGQTRFRTDLFIGEDFYFIYENLIKGTGAVFLKQKWYYCRLHESNSSWDYSFAGFRTRFFRRELVWKSEEAFGRTEFAACQKRQTLYIFLRCLRENPLRSSDSRNMRKVMDDYRKILLPVMTFRDKVRYYLAVYLPAVYLLLFQMINRLRSRFPRK